MVSRLIPIPIGRNTNITDSANDRAITLSSVFLLKFLMLFFYRNLVISYAHLRCNMVSS